MQGKRGGSRGKAGNWGEERGKRGERRERQGKNWSSAVTSCRTSYVFRQLHFISTQMPAAWDRRKSRPL